MVKRYIFGMVLVLMAVIPGYALAEQGASILFQKILNDMPDREGMVLTVEYPPGHRSSKHRHNAHTFVYVLEGSVVMQVEGGERMHLEAGKTFYETPDDVHVVSMNASTTEPARILVFFIKRPGAPTTVPVD